MHYPTDHSWSYFILQSVDTWNVSATQMGESEALDSARHEGKSHI